jgi:Ca2+-binding EF-hand superfamily protein
MKTVIILTAAGLAAASFLVLADAGGPGGHHGAFAERLKAADTNGDGMISRDEAKVLPMIAKHFDQIDANGDGFVTPEELAAAHRHHRGHGDHQ